MCSTNEPGLTSARFVSTPQMSVTVWVKFMTTVGAQQVSIRLFLVCREPCGSFSTTNVSGTELVWSRSYYLQLLSIYVETKMNFEPQFSTKVDLQLYNPKLALKPSHEPIKWAVTKFSFLGTKLPNPISGQTGSNHFRC